MGIGRIRAHAIAMGFDDLNVRYLTMLSVAKFTWRRWQINMEHLQGDTVNGNPKWSNKVHSQCYFAHQNTNMEIPWTESRLPRYKAGE
jgi:hypothetical protein